MDETTLPELFSSLPVAVQIGLGGGFLAYMLSSAGLKRGHTSIDVFMRSLAFGIPAILIFTMLSETEGFLISATSGIAISLLVAAIWRMWLCEGVIKAIHRAGVHADDYTVSAWDGLVQSKDFSVTQVTVRLKSGRELFLRYMSDYLNGPLKGLIVGTEGDIAMVVESEREPGGEDKERTRITDPNWGTRLTYIPAAEIEIVEFRCWNSLSASGADQSDPPANVPA